MGIFEIILPPHRAAALAWRGGLALGLLQASGTRTCGCSMPGIPHAGTSFSFFGCLSSLVPTGTELSKCQNARWQSGWLPCLKTGCGPVVLSSVACGCTKCVQKPNNTILSILIQLQKGRVQCTTGTLAALGILGYVTQGRSGIVSVLQLNWPTAAPCASSGEGITA